MMSRHLVVQRGICLLLKQHLFELAPLDLVTDHFLLAGHLGPGRFQTRSWSFRSKNRLAFIKKQSTPVLQWPPSGGLLRGGLTNSLGGSDTPTQGCQAVGLLLGQVSSVHS